MALKIKTSPSLEPVTLAETKELLRIDDNNDDSLISSMVTAIRQQAEEWTSRSLLMQTWTLWLDEINIGSRAPDWNGRVIVIPRPPLQSVTFIKTYDTENVGSVFDASNYFVDTAPSPGRIALNENSSWPTSLRKISSVEIEFITGYGVSTDDVPEGIRQGMLQWIKLLFANKSKLYESDESTPGLLEMNRIPIPPLVRILWEPYRLIQL
ncbi:MAG: phage head-tail connector protein [Nitrospinae bacterium]|nr:phage head-tail connector protein [Nitrospinota bacterium]